MFDLPLWVQVLVALLAVSAFARPRVSAAARVDEVSAVAVDSLWRWYGAVDAILRSQSRRFAEMDATLGVIAALEVTAALWFLDRAYHDAAGSAPHLGALVIAWSMAVPVTCALGAMRAFNGQESPDAAEFLWALEDDEEQALKTATATMARNFGLNQARLRLKDFAVSLSLWLFVALVIADVIGHMVHWW